MGRKNNALQVEHRRDEVEEALTSGFWSRRRARELAEKHNVLVREIYRDRAAVIEAWSRNISAENRERDAAQMLAEVRALRAEAARQGLEQCDGGVLRCAVQLLNLEADLLRLRDPVRLDLSIKQDDPTELAKTVVELLPFVNEVLDLDLPANVLDVDFSEVEK